ncbi:MAG: pseudaminic acid cytidylyltransferase [Fibrobacterota bacterium]
MSSVCIIPARGGSKRIPHKNIRSFLGTPILAYSIRTALESGIFDTVMVSTDDQKIAETARQYGARIPFFRSREKADDHAGLAAVIAEVLTSYSAQGRYFETACCLLPTAPFVTAEKLRKAQNIFAAKDFDTLFPIVEFSYPIQRALSITDDRVCMQWPQNLHRRSQDCTPAYHDAGQFYFIRIERFHTDQSLFTDNSGFILCNELEVQDIDTETDWKLAEIKYSMRKT